MTKNKKLQKSIYKLMTNSSGFTLTELLVAVIMTGIFVAGVGSVLTNVLQARTDLEQESARRKTSSRALDFISKELKSAKNIQSSPSQPSDYSSPADIKSGSNDLVIVATIPQEAFEDSSGTFVPAVYSIATPNSDNNWRGPNIIYRWGPPFNEDGTYDETVDPSNWETAPLMDFVTDENQGDSKVASYTSESEYCKDDTDTILPNDPPTQGFYLCLDEDNNRTGEIVIRTQPNEELKKVKNVIQVTTKVFARSAD